MPEPLAILIENVSKSYRLYGSQREQLVDVLGLNRFRLRKRSRGKEFVALNNVSLKVPRGHRIGIIGSNGAGKTTLLKLICGNFTPTSGNIEVNGAVQALMNMGLGFHPDFTGMENVKSSLSYNGLSAEAYKQALEDIVAFCELGDFMDQPFKTYSLGMQARLMFATATAIQPDILIIDEVLGAGDAYFIAKSRQRVEKLVNSGATMLLVSHSTQQILELCNEVIWIHEGRIHMQGDALVVVKAYEEYIHGKTVHDGLTQEKERPAVLSAEADTPAFSHAKEERETTHLKGIKLQEPHFVPHGETLHFPAVPVPTEFSFISRGGLSRWEGTSELTLCGFTIADVSGETNALMTMKPAKFILSMRASAAGHYRCRYAVVVYDHMNRCLLDIVSPCDAFTVKENDLHAVELVFNPLQLGPGEYVISISIHDYAPLEIFNATKRYDLLSRSFVMKVDMPDSQRAIETQFYHSAEWNFAEKEAS